MLTALLLTNVTITIPSYLMYVLGFLGTCTSGIIFWIAKEVWNTRELVKTTMKTDFALMMGDIRDIKHQLSNNTKQISDNTTLLARLDEWKKFADQKLNIPQ